MKFHVYPNPAPGTICNRVEVPDDAPPPDPPWVEMSPEEFQAWVAAQLAAIPREIPVDQVFSRMTSEERVALLSGFGADVNLRYFVIKALSTGSVNESHPDFLAAKPMLAAAGIIAEARWDEIFSG